MTWHALKQLMLHRFAAKGRHGVHSPFVYRFVEEVLRGKGRFEARLQAFLDRQGLELSSMTDVPQMLPAHDDHTVLLCSRIHADAAGTARWQALAQQPEVTLSLDLYDKGLLFFHPDFIVKQHFLLQ